MKVLILCVASILVRLFVSSFLKKFKQTKKKLISTRPSFYWQFSSYFQDVDIVLSVFSFFNCLLASFVLAIYARGTILWIVAVIIGFIVSLLYAIELCLLRERPPLNLRKQIHNKHFFIKLIKIHNNKHNLNISCLIFYFLVSYWLLISRCFSCLFSKSKLIHLFQNYFAFGLNSFNKTDNISHAAVIKVLSENQCWYLDKLSISN